MKKDGRTVGRSDGQTVQRELPAGSSLRAVARALGVSHPSLKKYLTTGETPAKHPDLAAQFAAYKQAKEDPQMLTQQPLPPECYKHFGCTKDPFCAEMDSVEDVYETRDLARAERKILRAVDHAGWCAITGPVGSGKTTLLKRVQAQLATREDVRMVEPRAFEKQYLGVSHILDAILDDLAIPRTLRRRGQEYKARAVGEILIDARAEGRKVVVFIDEAHLLREECLRGLKRLFEIKKENGSWARVLSIVLIGQPGLARQLKSNLALAEVAQRLDLYELSPLGTALAGYLAHKLQRAGCNGRSEDLFDKDAIKEMVARKADTPLAINNLAAAALLHAWRLREQQVTEATIKGL